MEPTPEASRPRRYKKWLWVAIGGITLHLSLILGVAGSDYLFNQLPQDSYQAIYDAPWLGLNVRALKFQNVEDFRRAERSLTKLAAQPSNRQNPIPHFLLAELYNTMEQPQRAILEYRKTIQTAQLGWMNSIQYQEYRDNAHAALAILAYEQGKVEQAQQELAQIDKTNENREAEVLTAMTDALDEPERGDFHLVLGKAFRKTLKLKMANLELHRAETLSQSPQTRLEAINFLKTQMPKGVEDLTPMARYYGLAARSAQTTDENLPKAASLFKKSLAEDPQFEWGYNELAIIYREMKDYPKATEYANNAISQNVDFYNPYLTLGDIALDQENYKAAIEHFQAAEAILNRLPQEDQQTIVANIENQIGFAYESMNDYPDATQHYQSALNLSSDAGDEADEDYNYAQDGLTRISHAQQRKEQKLDSADGKQISWKK